MAAGILLVVAIGVWIISHLHEQAKLSFEVSEFEMDFGGYDFGMGYADYMDSMTDEGSDYGPTDDWLDI